MKKVILYLQVIVLLMCTGCGKLNEFEKEPKPAIIPLVNVQGYSYFTNTPVDVRQ